MWILILLFLGVLVLSVLVLLSLVPLGENFALSLHELFLVFAAHNARSSACVFVLDRSILANLPEPRRVVLNLDLFVAVDALYKVFKILAMVHIVGKVYENEPELLACVAVGLGNHVDVLNATVAVCVRTEKLTENSLHIVRVELVVNARKAQRRDSDHSVGSHDSQERAKYNPVGVE